MEIYINSVQDYSKKEQTIIIKDKEIVLIEDNSCYQKIISDDTNFIRDISSDLTKIMFGWREEYIGARMMDGERYHIIVDINHRKKKYKIRNKYPDNWDEFLLLKKRIMEGYENDEYQY